jgi:hypothetical protein
MGGNNCCGERYRDNASNMEEKSDANGENIERKKRFQTPRGSDTNLSKDKGSKKKSEFIPFALNFISDSNKLM